MRRLKLKGRCHILPSSKTYYYTLKIVMVNIRILKKNLADALTHWPEKKIHPLTYNN